MFKGVVYSISILRNTYVQMQTLQLQYVGTYYVYYTYLQTYRVHSFSYWSLFLRTTTVCPVIDVIKYDPDVQ